MTMDMTDQRQASMDLASGATSHTAILACSSLTEYVEEAQKNAGTAYPVVYLNRLYHRDPEEMRAHILQALRERMPEGTGTVLVAMGYCGGSWEGVRAPFRMVLPRIDDCVSLLLKTEDSMQSDLKTPGHLYVRSKDPEEESFRRIFERLTRDIDAVTKERYHSDWKALYSSIDIMDTGINDCRRDDYAAAVQKDAEWLDAELRYVKGGTYLLEKMLRGELDEQFLVIEPGETVCKETMLIGAEKD